MGYINQIGFTVGSYDLYQDLPGHDEFLGSVSHPHLEHVVSRWQIRERNLHSVDDAFSRSPELVPSALFRIREDRLFIRRFDGCRYLHCRWTGTGTYTGVDRN
jgi:hypothetical protein